MITRMKYWLFPLLGLCATLAGCTSAGPELKLQYDAPATYFEEALFGVLVRWIRGESQGDTPEEMHAISERIRVIFTGCLDLMIENMKKNPLE